MIVWVASFPRSGNRLCRTTLRRVFGVRVGSAASRASLQKDLGEFLDELGIGPDEDPLPALRELDEPVFLKTHSLPEHVHHLPEKGGPPEPGQEDSPAVYLVRDGRDCLVSFAHYVVENSGRKKYASMRYEEALADLVRRRNPYGGWSGNVAAWRARAAPTAVVRFEDLADDPEGEIARATQRLGLEMPAKSGEMPSFEELQARRSNAHIMRRGKAGSWKSEFPPDLLELFWTRHGEQMDELGYSRN
jgi:hypothetical protein